MTIGGSAEAHEPISASVLHRVSAIPRRPLQQPTYIYTSALCLTPPSTPLITTDTVIPAPTREGHGRSLVATAWRCWTTWRQWHTDLDTDTATEGEARTNRSRGPLSYLARHTNPISFLFLVPHLNPVFLRSLPPPRHQRSILSLSMNLHVGH